MQQSLGTGIRWVFVAAARVDVLKHLHADTGIVSKTFTERFEGECGRILLIWHAQRV